MRLIGVAFAAACLCWTSPVAADNAARLHGTWRPVSYTLNSRPAGSADVPTAKRNLYGADPKGNMILTADGRIMVLVAKADEPAIATKAGPARLLGSMIAYFGHYSVQGNRLSIVLENSIASGESFMGAEQTQDFALTCPVTAQGQAATECDNPALYLTVRKEPSARSGRMSVAYVSHWIRD